MGLFWILSLNISGLIIIGAMIQENGLPENHGAIFIVSLFTLSAIANIYHTISSNFTVKSPEDNNTDQKNQNLISTDTLFEKTLSNDLKLAYILTEQTFSGSHHRLLTESDNIKIRASKNLQTSMIIAASYIVYISAGAYLSLTSNNLNLEKVIWIVAPSAILTQLLIWFFLRQYRQDLIEARYLGNELSNMEYHSLAAKMALLTKDANLTDDVVKSLLKVERNFKLAKGETTLFERSNVSSENTNDSILSSFKLFNEKTNKTN